MQAVKVSFPVFIILSILGCGYEVYYESSSSSSWQSSSSEPSDNLSSSSRQQSSSSELNSNLSSSSRQSGVISGTPVSYGDETYETVVIGTQTWFKRNLNYDPGNSDCYSSSASNCSIYGERYGRLYDWSTAMALPSSCNSSTCSLSISSKHQGICPSGWHIPSNEDWDKLFRYVDGTGGTESPYDSPTAGKYLKATMGWAEGRNGQDTYGFSALPGTRGDFFDVSGYWWSSSEYSSSTAYYRHMFCCNDYAKYGNYSKSDLWSVRCLRD